MPVVPKRNSSIANPIKAATPRRKTRRTNHISNKSNKEPTQHLKNAVAVFSPWKTRSFPRALSQPNWPAHRTRLNRVMRLGEAGLSMWWAERSFLRHRRGRGTMDSIRGICCKDIRMGQRHVMVGCIRIMYVIHVYDDRTIVYVLVTV